MTPLHLACELGHLDIVKFLIQNGASTTVVDEYKYTPVDYAIINRYRSIELLIDELAGDS